MANARLHGYSAITFARELQWDNYSCGARAAHMLTRHYGYAISYRDVRQGVKTTPVGTYCTDVTDYLRNLGLRVLPRHGTLNDAISYLRNGYLIMASVDNDTHLLILHGAVSEGRRVKEVYVADPSPLRAPWRKYATQAFRRRWSNYFLAIRDPSH